MTTINASALGDGGRSMRRSLELSKSQRCCQECSSVSGSQRTLGMCPLDAESLAAIWSVSASKHASSQRFSWAHGLQLGLTWLWAHQHKPTTKQDCRSRASRANSHSIPEEPPAAGKSICLSTARSQVAFAVTENDSESIGGPAALSSPSPGLPRTRRA